MRGERKYFYGRQIAKQLFPFRGPRLEAFVLQTQFSERRESRADKKADMQEASLELRRRAETHTVSFGPPSSMMRRHAYGNQLLPQHAGRAGEQEEKPSPAM